LMYLGVAWIAYRFLATSFIQQKTSKV